MGKTLWRALASTDAWLAVNIVSDEVPRMTRAMPQFGLLRMRVCTRACGDIVRADKTRRIRCGSGSVSGQHCRCGVDDFVLDLLGDRLREVDLEPLGN